MSKASFLKELFCKFESTFQDPYFQRVTSYPQNVTASLAWMVENARMVGIDLFVIAPQLSSPVQPVEEVSWNKIRGCQTWTESGLILEEPLSKYVKFIRTFGTKVLLLTFPKTTIFSFPNHSWHVGEEFQLSQICHNSLYFFSCLKMTRTFIVPAPVLQYRRQIPHFSRP